MFHKRLQTMFRRLELARARAGDMGRCLLRDKADDERPETLGRIRGDGEEVCVRAIEAHASEQGREGQAFLQGQEATSTGQPVGYLELALFCSAWKAARIWFRDPASCK